jgi:hypothetical protein
MNSKLSLRRSLQPPRREIIGGHGAVNLAQNRSFDLAAGRAPSYGFSNGPSRRGRSG